VLLKVYLLDDYVRRLEVLMRVFRVAEGKDMLRCCEIEGRAANV